MDNEWKKLCNLKSCQLLKVKGYDEPCDCSFEYFKSSVTLFEGWLPQFHSHKILNSVSGERVVRPFIQDVITWFIEEHQILITPYACSLGWHFEVYDLKNRDITGSKALYKPGIISKEEASDNYFEAAQKGIIYVLENLI